MYSGGADGVRLSIEDTIRSFEEIIAGKHDEIPEQAFYMKGGIDEVIEAHRVMLEEAAKKAS